MILSLSKERIYMDNIIIEKFWQDSNLIELQVTAKSEYAQAKQRCYVED